MKHYQILSESFPFSYHLVRLSDQSTDSPRAASRPGKEIRNVTAAHRLCQPCLNHCQPQSRRANNGPRCFIVQFFDNGLLQ